MSTQESGFVFEIKVSSLQVAEPSFTWGMSKGRAIFDCPSSLKYQWAEWVGGSLKKKVLDDKVASSDARVGLGGVELLIDSIPQA